LGSTSSDEHLERRLAMKDALERTTRAGSAPRHYVLRFRGAGQAPDADVRRICALAGARVLDESERTLLVEATDGAFHKLISSLPRWSIWSEEIIPLPDPPASAAIQTLRGHLDDLGAHIDSGGYLRAP
jgi:hypothetical protein